MYQSHEVQMKCHHVIPENMTLQRLPSDIDHIHTKHPQLVQHSNVYRCFQSHTPHSFVFYHLATSFTLQYRSSSDRYTRMWMNTETKYHKIGDLPIFYIKKVCTLYKVTVNCNRHKAIFKNSVFTKTLSTRTLHNVTLCALCIILQCVNDQRDAQFL